MTVAFSTELRCLFFAQNVVEYRLWLLVVPAVLATGQMLNSDMGRPRCDLWISSHFLSLPQKQKVSTNFSSVLFTICGWISQWLVCLLHSLLFVIKKKRWILLAYSLSSFRSTPVILYFFIFQIITVRFAVFRLTGNPQMKLFVHKIVQAAKYSVRMAGSKLWVSCMCF